MGVFMIEDRELLMRVLREARDECIKRIDFLTGRIDIYRAAQEGGHDSGVYDAASREHLLTTVAADELIYLARINAEIARRGSIGEAEVWILPQMDRELSEAEQQADRLKQQYGLS